MALQERQRQHGFRRAAARAPLCFSLITRDWTRTGCLALAGQTQDKETAVPEIWGLGAVSIEFDVLLRQAERDHPEVPESGTSVLSVTPDVRS